MDAPETSFFPQSPELVLIIKINLLLAHLRPARFSQIFGARYQFKALEPLFTGNTILDLLVSVNSQLSLGFSSIRARPTTTIPPSDRQHR